MNVQVKSLSMLRFDTTSQSRGTGLPRCTVPVLHGWLCHGVLVVRLCNEQENKCSVKNRFEMGK